MAMEKTDANTTLEELKKVVRTFCEERSWDPYHSPKDLAIGLVTEASELLEIFRFVRERDMADLIHDANERRKMADELADSLYFILRFAQLYKFDLAQCMREKMDKNRVKYPTKDPARGATL